MRFLYSHCQLVKYPRYALKLAAQAGNSDVFLERFRPNLWMPASPGMTKGTGAAEKTCIFLVTPNQCRVLPDA